MAALHLTVVTWAKFATCYQEFTSRGDAAYIDDFRTSAAVLRLRGRAEQAERFLRRHGMPARASRNVKEQIDILCGIVPHPVVAVTWIDALRYPVDPLMRAGIVCVTATACAILVVWPLVNAFLLQERAQIVLVTAATTRTAIMALALLRFKYITPRLVWKLLEKRLIGSLPSLIAYSLPAFDDRLRYLHGLEWYTYVVVALLFVWLALISFSSLLRSSVEQGLTRRKLPLSGDDRREAETLLSETETAAGAVYELIDGADISDWMRQFGVLLKADCDEMINQLRCCAERPQSVGRTLYPRAPKFKVVVIGAVITGLGLAAYRDYPIALAERCAYGSWAMGLWLWRFFSAYFAPENMLDLFSKVGSGEALALVTVTLWVLVTDGAVLRSSGSCRRYRRSSSR